MIKIEDFNPPYRGAVLKTYNDNLKKRWVVEYWPWNSEIEKNVRKQHFISSSKYKTANERIAYADSYIRDINNKLRQGYFIDKKDKETDLNETVENYLKYKLRTITSHKDYKHLFSKYFIDYFKKHKPKITVDKISKSDIYDFLDQMQAERNWSNVTRNGIRVKIYNFFQYLTDRDIISRNPVASVRNEKTGRGIRYYPFLKEEITMLRKYLNENDPILKFFTDFIYYCFLRPKEVRSLKISDIDIERNRIRISQKISKNTKTQYVQIPKNFKNIIKDSGVLTYKKHLLVFGNKGKPGLKQYGQNNMTTRMRNILNNFGYSNDYSLYSFKHSGCCQLYELTKDIKLISSHCRHSSIEITDVYLRSLGMYINNKAMDDFV